MPVQSGGRDAHLRRNVLHAGRVVAGLMKATGRGSENLLLAVGRSSTGLAGLGTHPVTLRPVRGAPPRAPRDATRASGSGMSCTHARQAGAGVSTVARGVGEGSLPPLADLALMIHGDVEDLPLTSREREDRPQRGHRPSSVGSARVAGTSPPFPRHAGTAGCSADRQHWAFLVARHILCRARPWLPHNSVRPEQRFGL